MGLLLMSGTMGVEAASGDRQVLRNAADVEAVLRDVAQDIRGVPGQWTADFEGARIVVFASEAHGRMRVVSPVAAASDLSENALRVLLAANYDRALDAKFAIADGQLWALFNHRLEGLTRGELVDGIRQVVTLRRNFGGSNRSTDLRFGAPPGDGG